MKIGIQRRYIGKIRMMASLSAVGVIATILLAGCLNQVGPKKSSRKSSPIFTVIGRESVPTVLVQKVVRSQIAPQKSVDLIGEAAFTTTNEAPRPHGELGSFCAGDSSGSGCKCVYRANIIIPCPTGGNPETCTSREEIVEIREAPVYYEADLVRCPLPELNTTVLSLSLEKTTSRMARSNVVSLTLTPDRTFDDPLFYAPVVRYGCRWSPFISHLMDPSVIDPIQSESPDTTLSLLYYSTNLGYAMAKFAEGDANKQQYFQCPPHVDPDKLSNTLKLHGNTLGSESQDFLVAKSASGPFVSSIMISQAPGISATEPLGYAALPNSADGNRCPTSAVSIPSNMEWRKLWLYRGVQERRKYQSSSKLRNFSVACNPGRLKNSYHVIQDANAKDANGVGRVLNLYSNYFYGFSDCGRRGFFTATSTSTTSGDGVLLDNGYSCSANGSLQFDEELATALDLNDTRILLNNTGGHRCISVNDSGSSWQDRCPISEFSCMLGGNQPEGLDLCSNKGSSADLKTDFASDVTNAELPSPVEYVFLTTDPSEDAPMSGLTRVQGSSNSSYLRVDKLNQAKFPLCVLRHKTGGP
jgi:hypothetical protein